MEHAVYEPRGAGHSFIIHPDHGLLAEQVIRSAEIARENSGTPQWVHHHRSGHLCTAKCGPVEGQRR